MTANETQIGGTHYKDMAVQPWDAMRAWMTPDQYCGYLLGTAIAYLARVNVTTAGKGGLQDIQKAQHVLAKLAECYVPPLRVADSNARDPSFEVAIDKMLRDSLLDKHKDGVPAGETVPHGFREGYRAMWGIKPIVEPTHYSGLSSTGSAPIVKRTDGPGIPGRVTYVGAGESLDDAAKRATVEAANARDNTSPAIMTFADGGVVGIEVWPGPDWSQAPEGCTGWTAQNIAGTTRAALWLFGPGEHSYDGLWDTEAGYAKSKAAPMFGYTGDWRDSLRKRPQ